MKEGKGMEKEGKKGRGERKQKGGNLQKTSKKVIQNVF